MTNYEVKLHTGGRDSLYLTFYIPRDLIEKFNLKAGQTVMLDDDQQDGLVLMIFNTTENK